jgi:hypothetical protein
MKIFVLFLLIATGCALSQTPVVSGPKFVENQSVMGIEIKRPSDDGRFESISVISEKFTTPVTVTRGSWPSRPLWQGLPSMVLGWQDSHRGGPGWMVSDSYRRDDNHRREVTHPDQLDPQDS